MPDPLDPTDAIVSAFTDMWKRTGAFMAVTAGAAFMGWNIHQAPNVFASFGTLKFAAIRQVYDSINSELVAGWFYMMVHSLFILWTLPFVLLYIWLLVRLWREGDLFQVLFLLAISHSVHTFAYLQRTNPMTGGALAGGVGLLILCELVTAGLLLWWRHVTENAPVDPHPHHETESEL